MSNLPHAAVTGASSGIGEAIARDLATNGYRVTLVARRAELLQKLADELGDCARVVVHDLSVPERATEWLADAEAAFGPIDVLVNNAGVQLLGGLSSADPEAGERLMRINVFSPLRLTRALLPAMIARGSGTIVDIASLPAIAPTPHMPWYSASKAALAAASETLHGELRGTGVHVVTVYPGPVDTPMASAALVQYGNSNAVKAAPSGTTDKLARLVRSAIKNKRDRIIYPRTYWSARWFPGVTRFVLDRLAPKPE